MTNNLKDPQNLFICVIFFNFRNLLDQEDLLKVKHVLEENDEILKNSFGVSAFRMNFFTIHSKK